MGQKVWREGHFGALELLLAGSTEGLQRARDGICYGALVASVGRG